MALLHKSILPIDDGSLLRSIYKKWSIVFEDADKLRALLFINSPEINSILGFEWYISHLNEYILGDCYFMFLSF